MFNKMADDIDIFNYLHDDYQDDPDDYPDDLFADT